MTEQLTYHNPTKNLVINDWPYGQRKVRADFTIVSKTGKGERAERVTINPKTGSANKPKVTTYADKARIVTGSDGRTYIVEWSNFGYLRVVQSNLQYTQETIWPKDGDRFFEIKRTVFGA